jgi:hypothetical protein
MQDFLQDANPVVSGATRVSIGATLGFGYRPITVLGKLENQFVLASSFAPNPLFWPAANVKYFFSESDPGLDLDIAAIWNPLRQLRAGLTIENLLGSSIERTTRTYERARMAEADLQYFWGKYSPDGINAYIKSGIERRDYRAGGGVEKRFFRNPQIGFRAGAYYQVQDSAESGITMGAVYQHDIKEQRVILEYAFNKSQNAESPSHYLTLHLGFYGARDRIPPEILIETNRMFLSPDGDEAEDVIYFKLRAEDNAGGVGFKNWCLIIASRDSTGLLVQHKAFVGGGIPPATIEWDGRDSMGVLVKQGTYCYQFVAADKNENKAITKWVLFQVK